MKRDDLSRLFAGLAAMMLLQSLPAAPGAPAAAPDGDGGKPPRVRVAATLDTLDGLAVEGDGRIVAEGPGGEPVLRTDGRIQAVIDLAARAIDPRDYDLIKIDVKADPRAWLVISLENYPEPGWISNWYVLDAVRGGFDWRPVWLDLKRPEEMYPAGKVGGMAVGESAARGLRINSWVSATKRVIQDPGRAVLLRNVRFVREAVHLDWDQTQVSASRENGGDLVFSYPLTLVNRRPEPVTARLALVPLAAGAARAVPAPDVVELRPGEAATVTAKVTLPAAAAAAAPPLASEFFEPRAWAEGLEDSEVTVLRSSDPIHLGVTVPVAEERLAFPLLPRRKDLPASVLGFDDHVRQKAVAAAEAAHPDDLDAWLGELLPDRFARPWRKGQLDDEAGNLARFGHGICACGILYDLTGDRSYLDKGTALLLRAAERFAALRERWSAAPMALISDGIFATNTLVLGWMTGGDWPAYDARIGWFVAFDLLAADMDPAARRRILEGLILPAALQMRNHYFGLTNQQDVVNFPVLYAGLATRNWPLAGFALAAEHGARGQIEWGFDEDGLCNEGHYQTAVINPLLWTAELLWHAVGIDLYDRRLHTILHSRAAAAIGKGYHGKNIVDYVDAHRFTGKPFLAELAAAAPTDGAHLEGGVTQLKWQGLALAMNWGTHIFRNAHDRCAIRFEAAGDHPLKALRAAQGGSYSHSCIDQSIVIVDEGIQQSSAATVTGFDVSGPVQFVQAASDEHYPGATIVRTFALVDSQALVVDRVTCPADRPAETVDWVFKMSGFELSVPLEERAGSWTKKPDVPHTGASFGAGFRSHLHARTDAGFSCGRSHLTMLGASGTELLVFPVWHQSQSLMVRRRNVTDTRFVALFSADAASLEERPVMTAAGRPARAVGLRVARGDGTVFHVIVNHEPEGVEVTLGGLKTRDRFATDYPEP